MVEVFKTNVGQQKEASILLMVLSAQFPGLKINFDLEDCDRILWVEGVNIPSGKIMETVCAHGYCCSVLVC